MSDDIYKSVFGSLSRSIIHTSTYSENGLAMRAGLATLQALDAENLGAQAEILGVRLRHRLSQAVQSYEMVGQVRGLGLLNGVEFCSPGSLRLRLPFAAFRKIHEGMFGQIVVMKLFREESVLTQMCGNNFMVWKAAPPLIVTEGQIDEYVAAVRSVVETVHSSTTFWMDALYLAHRAANI